MYFEFLKLNRRTLPGQPRVTRNRVGRRAHRQKVDHHQFAILAPARMQKSAVRLPSHGKSRAAIEHPRPIDAFVDCGGRDPDLGIVEMLASGEHSTQEQCGVDGREFAVPHALAGFHVDEVVEEAVLIGQLPGRERSVCRTRSRITAEAPYPRDSPMQRPVRAKPVAAILATRRRSPPLSKARSLTWPVAPLASFQKKS